MTILNRLGLSTFVLSTLVGASVSACASRTADDAPQSEDAISRVTEACKADENCRGADWGELRYIVHSADGKTLCLVEDELAGIKLSECRETPFAATLGEIWREKMSATRVDEGGNAYDWKIVRRALHPKGGYLNARLAGQGGMGGLSIGPYATEFRIVPGDEANTAQFMLVDGTTTGGGALTTCLALEVSSVGHATLGVSVVGSRDGAPDYSSCTPIVRQPAIQVYGVKDEVDLPSIGESCTEDVGCGRFASCVEMDYETGGGSHYTVNRCKSQGSYGDACRKAGDCISGRCEADSFEACSLRMCGPSPDPGADCPAQCMGAQANSFCR